jgi:hypothetical protein
MPLKLPSFFVIFNSAVFTVRKNLDLILDDCERFENEKNERKVLKMFFLKLGAIN